MFEPFKCSAHKCKRAVEFYYELKDKKIYFCKRHGKEFFEKNKGISFLPRLSKAEKQSIKKS